MSDKKHRDIELFAVDIFVAIIKIRDYTKAFSDASEFQHSSLHWDASIRQLEVIGEALNKLLKDESFNAVAPAYFRKIVNFRNVIMHGYFGIDATEVWDVVSQKLLVLEEDLYTIVQDNMDIHKAILSTTKEYAFINDTLTLRFLEKLNKSLYPR